MAFQIQPSYSTLSYNTTSYNNLPVEIKLHILQILGLETLVDTIRYIDKTHRLLVIDILKKYTLTQSDCNSYWFEFIKNQNTHFLHKFLKPQNKYIMIRSQTTNTNSLSWINYLRSIISISVVKNNSIMYGYILTKNFTYKNIRQYVTSNSPKWYLSSLTTSFIESILIAIEHNSLSVIRVILEYPDINFRFNKNDLEEQTFSTKMFYNMAKTAILHNRVDILKYFTLGHKYTNENYNDLLVLCANNTLIDTAIHENKPHVLDYILSKLTITIPSIGAASENQVIQVYNILDTTITKFINELSNSEAKNNIIIYFATKFSHKLTINDYKLLIYSIIEIDNINIYIDIVKKLMTLYLETHDVFHECPLFTTDELLIHNNLITVIAHIKMSLIYTCLKHSILYNNKFDTVLFLQDILYTNCIKYNLTKELFVKYICLDYIQYSIELNHNEIETKKMYSILLKDLPSIYDLDNIKSIMNLISIKYSAIECYKYFHNLFIQKSVLSRKIYIELLKDNLYIAILNTSYCAILNHPVLAFILLKLKEIGESNLCQDEKYIPLFINFIKTKNDSIIELMCNNGFNVSGHNEYLQLAVKTRCISLIKLLINCGADISSHNYAILHYALKQKTKKLAIFIKEKMTTDNKLQEYLDWETKFLSF